MTLRASIGRVDKAVVTKDWSGDFAAFVEALLAKVPVVKDKAESGWVCGAAFHLQYRHSENYDARHFLSLDYDHIAPADVERILGSVCKGHSFLAYTTWSHTPDNPRLRVWIPLSRGTSNVEFQAISRAVAARLDIELAARESHTPCQFMFRPAAQEGIPFQHWEDTSSPYLNVEEVLNAYIDFTDKGSWPKRRDGDELHAADGLGSALDKPGLVGAFCRAFRITEAIDRFELPYRCGSGETRWTYSNGSRADGAVSYDDDTKLHSYNDTDPARGQHNAYDLVRLHRFGALDADAADVSVEQRQSTRAMEEFCRAMPEFAEQFSSGLDALEDEEPGEVEHRGVLLELPDEIDRGVGKCNDMENARRIQRAFKRHIIAVAGKFYIWQETHWRPDDHEGYVWKKVTKLPLIIKAEAAALKSKFGPGMTEEEAKQVANLEKWAFKCSNKGPLDSCREMLRKLLNFDGEMLNTDPRLLNTTSCTINLETGDTKPHDPQDFITACAPTAWDPAAVCPRFEKFIYEIFQGDLEVISFVQRWLGYCVTGETREQALVFHVGKGGNGKSTLMRVLGHVLGSYATMGAKTLLTGKSGISNDVAALMGRRMVTLNETRQNEEFDQSQLKELTGGDKLSARFLHKEFFEFAPTHKMQIFTNHEPTIVGEDGGMWRRMLLLRYRVRYGTAAQVATGEYQVLRDEKLEDVLKAEASGVLRWLAKGAEDWYANKLGAPQSVLSATAALRDEQDIIGAFLRERTVKDPAGRIPNSGSPESLYTAYKGWMAENGHKYKGRTNFLKQVREALAALEEKTWEEKGEWYRGFVGIRLARGREAA